MFVCGVGDVCVWSARCLCVEWMFPYIIAIVLPAHLAWLRRAEAEHKNSVYGGYIESQNNLLLNCLFVLLISSRSLHY